MDCLLLLVYNTATVDQELLLRYEYLVTENQVRKAQMQHLLADASRGTRIETGLAKHPKEALTCGFVTQYDVPNLTDESKSPLETRSGK